MSWIENIKNILTVTTGDGKVFSPLWMNATKAYDYNVAEFEFPELDGTLVKRGRKKGSRYAVEFYFQGDEHLTDSRTFEESAKDTRPWSISHPMYGLIVVQPLGLSFDNSSYNTTKITGTVIETLTDDKPSISVSPIDAIASANELLQETNVNNFDETLDITDINATTATNDKNYKLGVKAIKLPEEASEYFNLFNVANSAVLNITSLPIAAIRATQAFIAAPSLFKTSVKNRIGMLSEQFIELTKVKILKTGTRSSKKLLELQGANIISAMAIAAANPITGDYANRDEVYEAIETITNTNNKFIEYLDNIKADNGGIEGGYVPDYGVMSSLNELVGLTVSNLFNIALGAKQERTFILDEDSNLIIVAHKIYGLKSDDSTIDQLINENKIGLNEILQFRKGRKFIYYV